MIDDYDPALMFTIPRLAIVWYVLHVAIVWYVLHVLLVISHVGVPHHPLCPTYSYRLIILLLQYLFGIL